MVRITYEAVCAAPVAVTFDYVDELGASDRWMFGVTEVVELDDEPHGVGKIYESRFHVKPVTLKTQVRVAERVVDQLIVTDSVGGFPVRSTWRFTPVTAEQTKIDATIDYDLPGGIAGKALGRALEPIVGLCLRKSDSELRKQVAALYAVSRERR